MIMLYKYLVKLKCQVSAVIKFLVTTKKQNRKLQVRRIYFCFTTDFGQSFQITGYTRYKKKTRIIVINTLDL